MFAHVRQFFFFRNVFIIIIYLLTLLPFFMFAVDLVKTSENLLRKSP